MKDVSKMTLSILLVLIVTISIATFAYLSNSLQTQRETTTTMIDSLNGEISTLQIDNGRYEIILERVYQMDSNLYNKAIENVE